MRIGLVSSALLGMGLVASVGAQTATIADGGRVPLVGEIASFGQSKVPKLTNQNLFTGIQSFSPTGSPDGGRPLDPNADAGKKYVVEVANSIGMQVFSLDGDLLGSLPRTGLDTACGRTTRGDPVVLFDEKDTWGMCVYVSKKDSPLLGWRTFRIATGDAVPDYPKIGVWPSKLANALVIGTQEANYNVWALDRMALIKGASDVALQIGTITRGNQAAQAFAPIPASLANIQKTVPSYMGIPVMLTNNPNSAVTLFEFKFNFKTPSASSVAGPQVIATDKPIFGFPGADPFAYVPITGGATAPLDPLYDIPMWRLNFAMVKGRPTLVGSLATVTAPVDGAPLAVYWFELNRAKGTSGTWSLKQDGIVGNAPGNTLFRWASTSSINKYGDICVGYTTSSATERPGARYSCRKFCDAPGTMRSEVTLFQSGVNLAEAFNRWGDYSSLDNGPTPNVWYLTTEIVRQADGIAIIGLFKFNPALPKKC